MKKIIVEKQVGWESVIIAMGKNEICLSNDLIKCFKKEIRIFKFSYLEKKAFVHFASPILCYIMLSHTTQGTWETRVTSVCPPTRKAVLRIFHARTWYWKLPTAVPMLKAPPHKNADVRNLWFPKLCLPPSTLMPGKALLCFHNKLSLFFIVPHCSFSDKNTICVSRDSVTVTLLKQWSMQYWLWSVRVVNLLTTCAWQLWGRSINSGTWSYFSVNNSAHEMTLWFYSSLALSSSGFLICPTIWGAIVNSA